MEKILIAYDNFQKHVEYIAIVGLILQVFFNF